eukprot:Gb_01820 [translate_table: standard]
MKEPKFIPTIATPTAAKSKTRNQASGTERSPAAIGRKGLFTLSIPISYIWLIPTM